MDVFNIPENNKQEQWFFANESGITTGWQTWHKPPGCSLIYIICIGAGGGGGNGRNAAAGNNRGGGGGGGSGAITKVIAPAMLLPERLSVQVGRGGIASGTGGSSVVSIQENNGLQYLVAFANGGAGGGQSGSGVGGTAGGGAAASGLGNFMVASIGCWLSIGGAAGVQGATASGTGVVGLSITPFVSTVLSGGASGGAAGADNVNGAGGDITAGGLLVNTIPGGIIPGGAGNGGITIWKPFFSTGGTGGGSNGGIGGAGGRGGIGSGGGGGGAGTTAGPAGLGGHGAVLIIAY